MADWAKKALSRPIHLADEVAKACGQSNRPECEQDLKRRAEKLAALLRQAARQADLYERLAIRILGETELVLEKALHVAQRCSHQSSSFLSRLFPVQSANFKKLCSLLDNSLSDVSWLLRVSNPSNDDEDGDFSCVGLPPIASNEPILCFIWEQVARLQFGPPESRPEAAAALSAHARNDRYRRVIVEEGGAAPLLRLLKEGRPEGQENAVATIALLAKDPESVEDMVKLGACSVLASVLKEGTMKVQTSVANAIAEFAIHFPKSQDVFLQLNTERLLVGHLAFETIEEHSKYSIHSFVPKASMHSVVQSTMHATRTTTSSSSSSTAKPFVQQLQQGKAVVGGGGVGGGGFRGRENEAPETKAKMKAAAAAALGMLCRKNPAICKNVTESRAMLCFAVLLEKGSGEVRSSSALALMEIAKVAEEDADLRHSAFKPTTPAAKAVVDQLLKVVERGEYDELLIPCVVSLGCLAKTFRASETRIIPPLVKLLDQKEMEVMKEAVVALIKFTSQGNYLCVQHSKAVIEAGGAKHLVQLVYFEEHEVKVPALVLLCWIAKAVPDSEELAEGNVLNVLEWASKQSNLVQDEALDKLLPDTRRNVELYQSRFGTNATVITTGGNAAAGAVPAW